MNKTLKRISLISLSICTLMLWTSPVKAKSECAEHTNYYFLQGMWPADTFSEYNKNNDNEPFINKIYLPSLGSIFNGRKIQNIKEEITNPTTTEEIDNYYNDFKVFFTDKANDKTHAHQIASKKQTEKYKYYESEDGKIHYYYHVTFYTEEEQKDAPKVKCENGCNLVSVKKAALKLYGKPEVTTKTDEEDNKTQVIEITRRFANYEGNIAHADDIFGQPYNIEPLGVIWYGKYNDEMVNTYVSPVLYKVTYEVCDEPTYNATIDYLDKDTNDKVADSYVDANLEDGYTLEKDSPEVKNCTPDKEKVTIKIDGKDFKDVVYYTCKKEDNPETGNILIFIAWAVGLGALGYSVYWFKKNKKEEV